MPKLPRALRGPVRKIAYRTLILAASVGDVVRLLERIADVLCEIRNTLDLIGDAVTAPPADAPGGADAASDVAAGAGGLGAEPGAAPVDMPITEPVELPAEQVDVAPIPAPDGSELVGGDSGETGEPAAVEPVDTASDTASAGEAGPEPDTAP